MSTISLSPDNLRHPEDVNQLIILTFLIAFVALILRLAFSFYLSKYWYGELTFSLNDTFSYINSFKNLWYQGRYSFDLNNIDAYYYRAQFIRSFTDSIIWFSERA